MISQTCSFGTRRAGLIACFAGLAAAALTAASLGPDLRLMDAAKSGDKKAVVALLKEKVDVNATTPGGSTPLAWAAERANDEIAQLLLAAGAKPDTANDYGESPLTLACANKSCWRLAPMPRRRDGTAKPR